MRKISNIVVCNFFLLSSLFAINFSAYCQNNTQIRGFVDVTSAIKNEKLSFALGEQDLFITSELNDRFSFLGESVFKFTSGSPTTFSVSIERIIVKYNYAGNHNILIGKHHTPINYWNDTYHHGRVFFPTIYRPILFDAHIIPLHTTGISFQGQNLGDLRFGYDLMIGNGIGSTDVLDNDKRKSITAAIHAKPADGLRIGVSWYNDMISKGSKEHDGDHIYNWDIHQNLFTGSVAYFGDKVEVLSEITAGRDKTDTTGIKNSLAAYLYGGVKIKEKYVPYFRLDRLHFQEGEIFFDKDNKTSVVIGFRYNINYLTAVKLEYQYLHSENNGNTNSVTAQVAIGF
ncbi:MAG TPA: hypothetical protein PKC72_09275 [Chitinophagaceae bacterium]|nr:hypothetical protein [Chitinophagaceae bacterium]